MLAQIQQIATPDVEFSWLLPVIFMGGGAMVLMVLGSLGERAPRLPWHAAFAIVASSAALVASVINYLEIRDDGPVTLVAGAVRIDGLAVFMTGTIAVGVILATLLTDGYLRREQLEGPDGYVLMMLSASGGIIMASANDLIVLFLGLEILSIAVYVLAGLHLRRIRSGEAALKYFILGSFSSAFMLFGIAFVYGATGSTNLTDISSFLATNILTNDVTLLAGFAMLLVGLGFKVAAVPFHAWTPDVYDGAPSPIVAYMASAVKVAGFAGLIRVFVYAFGIYRADWQPILYVLAVATLVVGSVVAVSQTNVKRMLAYSSISHAGFVLIGVQAASGAGVRASLFYLAAYTFMVAGSFGVVTIVGRTGDNAHRLDDYRGLAKRSPLLAFAFLVFLLAQAGVPLTSGFFAKFGVLAAAIDASSYWLALAGMLTSVISAYVYLRIVLTMYGQDGADAPRTESVPMGARIAIVASVIATLGFGIIPGPLNDLARDAAEIDNPPAEQPAVEVETTATP